MIRLYNTLSNKVEDFEPIEPGQVSMYHCGPTVYDFIHIGNLRAFYLADLLRRTFEYEGYKVKQVMNITDVGQLSSDADEGEDKMTKGLKREGKPVTIEAMKVLADFYTEKFKEDISKLNILFPTELPKASENINEDIELIQTLESKGFTYKTSDGVYFDVSKANDYGQLGGINADENNIARVEANSEKKNPKDFALWKFNEVLGFPSPWGQGFPGWHIECSAMSKKYLGEHFDIHTGGIDLAPIHHNNEIAQSENACGHKTVNYWIHNEFVIMGEDKMSKSLGNFITLRTIEEKGFSPVSYRYFLLSSHYKTQTNFTWEALEASQNAYRKLKEYFSILPTGGSVNNDYKNEFTEKIENNLNTPESLAVVWKLVKDEVIKPEDKRATLLDFDQVLGLDFEQNEFEIKDVPEDIQKLLIDREMARSAKNWSKADLLRDEIKSKGFEVKDGENGQILSKI